MFNPYIQNMDNLMQQRQLLDQQLNMMQSYGQQPNVTVNNMTAPTPNNFDFNGIYVANEEEARKVIGNNKPVLSIDQNEPYLYMSHNGVFKKYLLQEVKEEPAEDERLGHMQAQINAITEQLQSIVNTLSGQTKQPSKRGKTNEPTIQADDKQL